MFRIFITRVFFTGFLIFSCGSFIFAQQAEPEMQALEKSANQSFNDGAYEIALTGYRNLRALNPRNSLYNYYAGICLVQLNRDLEKAVEMLHFASGPNVPDDVYFYLGEAYRKQYDFKRAKKSYIKFDKEAPRALAKKKDVKLLIRSADRAVEITNAYNPVELLNLSFLDLNNQDHYKQLKGKGGILTRKPDALFSENEDRDELNGLMFMPAKVSHAQYVYFSGFQRSKNKGFQIMRARRGKAGKWIDIEPVEALNSDRDEILPYFDPVGMDIYFASDGYSGLGGFDLYRSHFDEEKGTWTQPENVGFPVNSVYDDYILIPGTDLGMIMIVSARRSRDTALATYRLNVVEPRQSLASASPNEIRRIANLGFMESDINNNLTSVQQVVEKERQLSDDHLPEQSDELQNMGLDFNHEKIHETEKNKDKNDKAEAYQSLITSALTYQIKADSLSELSSNAAVMIRKLEDPDDRWVYQKNIMVWNKHAEEHRQMADSIFQHISVYEQSELPSAIERDTVINEMIVYKYKPENYISEKAKQAFGGSNSSVNLNSESSDNDVHPISVESPPAENPDISGPEMGEVIQGQAQSVYREGNSIEELHVPEAGASYRIQLAVLSKMAGQNEFEGIYPISYETVKERLLYRFYAGHFFKFEDADRALTKIRQSGYSDAYIVSWYNGNKMSYEKVRKLEK